MIHVRSFPGFVRHNQLKWRTFQAESTSYRPASKPMILTVDLTVNPATLSLLDVFTVHYRHAAFWPARADGENLAII
jgi:hypothetical protein